MGRASCFVFVGICSALLASGSSPNAQTSAKKPQQKSGKPVTSQKSGGASKPTAAAPASSHKPGVIPAHSVARRRNSRGKAGHAAPSYQLHPEPARYAEIQKALADRGYFKGQVNGTWGDESVNALKRFQADQKLPDDGKISALSLTGLGLGPKHDGSTAAAAPAPTANALEPPTPTVLGNNPLPITPASDPPLDPPEPFSRY